MKNASVKILHDNRMIPIHAATGFFAVTLTPGSYILTCKFQQLFFA